MVKTSQLIQEKKANGTGQVRNSVRIQCEVLSGKHRQTVSAGHLLTHVTMGKGSQSSAGGGQHLMKPTIK